MEYVVDMQGFKKPGNDYVLKELAIAPLQGDEEPVVLLFKPPFPWRKLTEKYKRQNLWLELCYHGIAWNSGEHDYDQIGTILRDGLQHAKKILVNDEDRKKWLERFGFNVSNITEWGYPDLESPKQVTVCTNHNGAYKSMCALQNVKLMKHFYFNASSMEWEDISSD